MTNSVRDRVGKKEEGRTLTRTQRREALRCQGFTQESAHVSRVLRCCGDLFNRVDFL